VTSVSGSSAFRWINDQRPLERAVEVAARHRGFDWRKMKVALKVGIDSRPSPTAHQGALSYAKARKLLDGREQILASGSISRELVPWLP
jgi:hypothetical protein